MKTKLRHWCLHRSQWLTNMKLIQITKPEIFFCLCMYISSDLGHMITSTYSNPQLAVTFPRYITCNNNKYRCSKKGCNIRFFKICCCLYSRSLKCPLHSNPYVLRMKLSVMTLNHTFHRKCYISSLYWSIGYNTTIIIKNTVNILMCHDHRERAYRTAIYNTPSHLFGLWVLLSLGQTPYKWSNPHRMGQSP